MGENLENTMALRTVITVRIPLGALKNLIFQCFLQSKLITVTNV